ncbi:MAG: hypothetical protein DME65_03850 [Verrucomicrobia bacterium]|nr:MAG: hypothetical protein DME65_03850 [Verrucomicrobiota bacterium]
MTDLRDHLQPHTGVGLPKHQQAIAAACAHPRRHFVEFEESATEQSIPARFAQQVKRHGQRVAVKTRERGWTYQELNRRANRVAEMILAMLGHGPEPVCLLFASGIDAVAGLLGTLKAGKFYVPLDPAFPHARLAAILEDSGARLLLTSDSNRDRISEFTSARVCLLDMSELDDEALDKDVFTSISPTDLACLIYTSGSTGQPKGVMQTHRTLLHWAMVHTNELRITPEDRLTFLHSWSVGSGLFHLWASLLNGAALFPFDVRVSAADQLARYLRQERLTVYHSIPAVFRELTASFSGQERFPDLSRIILSGAPMLAEDVELYKRYFAANSILLHMMGAAEIGWVRRYFINETTKTNIDGIPVGYAVKNSEVMLLEQETGETIDGARIGEIAVKSRYLAFGYWRQPEETVAKFAPAPEGAGLRIYRTGDIGRMEPDGLIFHAGRKDFQVKVRGHRVEIGEVERALVEHPSLKEAAGVGRRIYGDTQLVAYVVPAPGHNPNVSELRSFLKDRLADYMLPATYVTLVALPRTPNGKLDYAALPPPDTVRPPFAGAYMAPETELEWTIALAWREVLALERVGLHDNFFDLGGNSLLLAQLHRRLQADLRKDIPIVHMLQHTTVSALVRYLAPQACETAAIGSVDDCNEPLRAVPHPTC